MDRYTLGNTVMHRVEQFTCKMPLAYFSQNEAAIQHNWSWMFPLFVDADRLCDNVFQSWILEVDGKIVLIDPCTGNGELFPTFPIVDKLDIPYIERIQATGIRPEDVDYVICTHLHMDHCGWNTMLRDGRYVPTFPNARYIMAQREYDRWDTRRPGYQPVAANAGVFENSVLPVVEAGLAQIIPDRFRLSDSLFIEPAHGHTAGHSLLRVETGVREAYFVADAFHHPIEIADPDFNEGASEDWPTAHATRLRIIDECLAKDALVVAAHFPCPFGGAMRRQADGHVIFEPLPGLTASHYPRIPLLPD